MGSPHSSPTTNTAAATDGEENGVTLNKGSEMISIKSRILFHESCLDPRIRDRALKLILMDCSQLFMDRTFLNVRFHSVLPNGSDGGCSSVRIEKAKIQEKCDLIMKLIARKMMEHEELIARNQKSEAAASNCCQHHHEGADGKIICPGVVHGVLHEGVH